MLGQTDRRTPDRCIDPAPHTMASGSARRVNFIWLPLQLRPRHREGDFGTARSVRLFVPWRSCLGYRHAGCLQLSHRRPPEICGLRTRPRTDVDPPRFLDPWTDADGLIGGETIFHRRTACHRRSGVTMGEREKFIYHDRTQQIHIHVRQW